MFQSPCGDSLFSDLKDDELMKSEQETGFNPLAGIRCFLTHGAMRFTKRRGADAVFQSPCGDSLFSDCPKSKASTKPSKHCFNPLAGIRKKEGRAVSIPLRGFVVF